MPENNNYTLSSLLCGGQKTPRLSVPIYQRLFVWGEDQINQLLSDLYDAYQNKRNKYYIGIITIVERDEADGCTWEVVDGQQRLTFLTLLACELVRRDVKNKECWEEFVKLSDHELRMKYIGRPDDEKDLLAIAYSSGHDEIKNPNMRRFFECFDRFLSKYFDNKDMDKDRLCLDQFSVFVYERVAILSSKLDDQYTAFELNTYFERLNATGRQLEPEEIIKGVYFSEYAEQWNKLTDFSEKYSPNNDESNKGGNDEVAGLAKTVLDILSTSSSDSISDQKNPQSSYTSQAIFLAPVFLLHVLSLNLNDREVVSFNPRRLIETFKNKFDPGSKKMFMENMTEYRRWLDAEIIYNDNGELKFRENNNECDDVDENLNSDKRKLLQFQSMLTVSSGEAQRWVLDAYRDRNSRDMNFLEKLKKKSCEEHRLPEEERTLNYRNIDRYWFWLLDYLLWETYEEKNSVETFDFDELKAIKNYKFRRNRSIEHLHPQTQAEGNEWDDKSLNCFGNLAMISTSFNSQQSNSTVGVKFGNLKDRIDSSKPLESIKLLLMFKAAGGKDSGWNVDRANKHQGEMEAKLKEFYRKQNDQRQEACSISKAESCENI